MRDDVLFYDRDGKIISAQEHSMLLLTKNYVMVAVSDVVSANGKDLIVATYWAGIDYSNGFAGEPLIYKTTCRYAEPDGEYHLKLIEQENELPFDYYSNEFDAFTGHTFICEWIQENDI